MKAKIPPVREGRMGNIQEAKIKEPQDCQMLVKVENVRFFFYKKKHVTGLRESFISYVVLRKFVPSQIGALIQSIRAILIYVFDNSSM